VYETAVFVSGKIGRENPSDINQNVTIMTGRSPCSFINVLVAKLVPRVELVGALIKVSVINKELVGGVFLLS